MVCRDLLSYPLPQLPSSNPASILNPNYVEPADGIISGFSILFYLGTTPYEFTKFYNPPTMEIEDVRGFERGRCTFQITDWSPDAFNLPFIPLVDQKIEVWNQNQTDMFFSGKVASVTSRLIVRRDDGTEVLIFSVVCKDQKEDFERHLISERYENVTTGFIVKDVITRYTNLFDASTIDPLIGRLVKDFRVSQDYAGQVIQRCLDIEGNFTFWVDPDTRQCYYGENVDILNSLPVSVNENNVYELFDAPDFTLAADRQNVRNVVKFFYDGKYEEGTVSVLQGSRVVFGQGTKFKDHVAPGSRLTIDGGDTEYTVDKVETDTQLRISSEYQEEDIVIESGVPFNIIGTKMLIIATDQTSIATMANINNEPGVYPERSQLAGRYEFLVSESNTPLTREEARRVAEANLANFSQPLVKGEAKTNNHKLGYANLRAGQTIRFDLPISRQIAADVVIQRIMWKDTGAHMVREEWGEVGDTRIDPVMIMNLDFQDRVYDIRNQIKRLQADVRRVNDSGTIILDDINYGENIFVDDCVELVDPLTSNGQPLNESIQITNTLLTMDPYNVATDEIAINDAAQLNIPPTGMFYTQPTSRQSAYCVGLNGFSACS